MTSRIDVLIPTCGRPAALAVTLASLGAPTRQPLRIVIADQTADAPVDTSGEVRAVVRVLTAAGHAVEVHTRRPRRGMAEQRQFLLDRTQAPYALFLDDDLILEPYVVALMAETLGSQGCGFVGCAPIGLSYLHDVRPEEQHLELWAGAVTPERVRPATPAWQRHRLHNAANVYHVQQRLGLTPATPRVYRIAWVGGCVMYDVAKLRATGGFGFWRDLPAVHAGEDVVAQVRVMERFGGCGVLPSGVFHMELPTTIADRQVDAWRTLL